MSTPATEIVPPVPVEAPHSQSEAVKALTLAQRVARADKGALVASAVHVAVLLTAAIGLHLSAQDTAILGSIVAAGLGYFLNKKL